MRRSDCIKSKVISDVSKCDLASEDIRTATSWICHCDTFGVGTVFEGWPNMKQKNASEGPSEDSKITFIDDVQNLEHRNINNKNYGRVKDIIL